MSSVQAFVSGANGSMKELTETAIKLGGSTVFTGAEVGDAMVELGKAGLDAQQVLKSVDGVLALATAGSLGIAEAAGIAGSAMKQFSLDASQAGFVADALAKAASSGNTTLGILGNQLTFVSQAAQRVGMDFEETIGFIAFLSDGIGAEKAGRGAGAIVSAMSSQTPAAKAAMEELGVSFTTMSGKFKGMPEIVNEFNSALSGLNPEEKSRQLSAIFNEQAIRGFEFALKRGGDEIDKQFAKVKQNAGFAESVSGTLLNNTSGAFTKVGNSLSAIATNLWQAFGPPSKAILEGWAIIFNNTLVPVTAGFSETLNELADGSAWKRIKEHGVSTFEAIGKSIVKALSGMEDLESRAKPVTEFFEVITEPTGKTGLFTQEDHASMMDANPARDAIPTKDLKALASSVFGDKTFGAADAAAASVKSLEQEAAERDRLVNGFQDFMNDAIVPGLSLMQDSLPKLGQSTAETAGDPLPVDASPLSVALKGSREAFDVINKAIKGSKGDHQKTIAKESEKQTKLLQKTVDLIDGIPDAMSNPEVFSFA